MPESFTPTNRPGPRVGSSLLLLGLASLIALGACWQRDYRFEGTASYRAPRNGLLVEGEASGLVPAGWDVSRDYRGRFLLRPEDDQAAAGVEISLSSELPGECIVAGRERLGWKGARAADSLRKALEKAGIEVRAPEELEAVAHVMNGLVAGPKSVVLEGQTDLLEVLEVRLDYPIR